MKTAIIGARLAGSYAAIILSRLGHEVILFDPAGDGEKACGGGVTPKALRTMSWLCQRAIPCREIGRLELTTLEGRRATITLTHPIRVFSRAALDSALRNEAVAAGTRFIEERASGFQHNAKGWGITTPSGDYHEVDFLIGADGAGSMVRAAVAGKFDARDLLLALGHYLPGVHHPDKLVVEFQEAGFYGYLWSFPRADHASIGIVHPLRGARAADLRRRVDQYISMHHPGLNGSVNGLYAARIPCLRMETLRRQRVCGTDWALLGDAAGFVDPITAEGIYFALRSAELLGDALRDRDPLSFERRWRLDFGADLVQAATWRERFYAGTFLRKSFILRALQLLQGSSTIRSLADRLICGTQTYGRMSAGIARGFPRILAEAAWELLFSRIRHNAS